MDAAPLRRSKRRPAKQLHYFAVIGQGPLNGLVYFILTNLIPAHQEVGEILFFTVHNATTGERRWQNPLCGRTVSSPVAAIPSDGRGYLYQGDSEGNLYILEGFTGEAVEYLSLGGSVTAAQALYQQHPVVRITKDGQEVLCGVWLGE